MKKNHIGLMITAIILFAGLFGFEKAEGAVRTPFLYIYSIAGKDHQGIYKGTATIVYAPNSRKIDTVLREIRYEKGLTESSAGTGTIANNVLSIQISNTRQPPVDIRKPAVLTHPIKPLPNIAATLSGSMNPNFSKARLHLRRLVKGEQSIGAEDWTLQSKKPVYETSRHKMKVNKNAWATVPITVKKPCVAYVQVRGKSIPRGLFLARDKRFPKLKPLDEYDSSIPPLSRSPENPYALPSAFSLESGAVSSVAFYCFSDSLRTYPELLQTFIK